MLYRNVLHSMKALSTHLEHVLLFLDQLICSGLDCVFMCALILELPPIEKSLMFGYGIWGFLSLDLSKNQCSSFAFFLPNIRSVIRFFVSGVGKVRI